VLSAEADGHSLFQEGDSTAKRHCLITCLPKDTTLSAFKSPVIAASGKAFPPNGKSDGKALYGLHQETDVSN
jgi:hypothetical protein